MHSCQQKKKVIRIVIGQQVFNAIQVPIPERNWRNVYIFRDPHYPPREQYKK